MQASSRGRRRVVEQAMQQKSKEKTDRAQRIQSKRADAPKRAQALLVARRDAILKRMAEQRARRAAAEHKKDSERLIRRLENQAIREEKKQYRLARRISGGGTPAERQAASAMVGDAASSSQRLLAAIREHRHELCEVALQVGGSGSQGTSINQETLMLFGIPPEAAQVLARPLRRMIAAGSAARRGDSNSPPPRRGGKRRGLLRRAKSTQLARRAQTPPPGIHLRYAQTFHRPSRRNDRPTPPWEKPAAEWRSSLRPHPDPTHRKVPWGRGSNPVRARKHSPAPKPSRLRIGIRTYTTMAASTSSENAVTHRERRHQTPNSSVGSSDAKLTHGGGVGTPASVLHPTRPVVLDGGQHIKGPSHRRKYPDGDHFEQGGAARVLVSPAVSSRKTFARRAKSSLTGTGARVKK